ncbi:MAG: histidine--tRNA ligase [Clostridia bacterium]|nr:histidine--tRNA ligase [Clostridia bacterium]
MMINIPKGTKDCLPQDSAKWQYIEKIARDVASNFGIKEIRTPTFEHTEVFLRGIGDTTDVVNKEMYTFLDKGNRSITLKPEGTAGVARAFVEKGLVSSVMPLKLFYITPCFRYERPQAGRLREFHQFGIEIFGAEKASIDAEVILTARAFFEKLGVTGLKLYINSIGCKKCRAEFNTALKNFLKEELDNMCPTCQERYERNPLRILDCKEEKCKEICAKAPKIIDYLCEDCQNHFNDLKEYLALVGVEYGVNPNIVRGLDYYTKTVFEFVSENIGAQGTVCGGGRYDGLIEEFGGAKVAGVGFGLGLERLILLMESLGLDFNEKTTDIYFATIGEDAYKKAFVLADDLRRKGISCEIDHMGKSVKAQFKYADKIGAKKVAVIGDDELANGVINLKTMSDGTSRLVKFEDIASEIE